MESLEVGKVGNTALQLGPGSVLTGGVDTVKDVAMAEKRKNLKVWREREGGGREGERERGREGGRERERERL